MELSIGGTIGSAEELVELDFGVEGDKVAPVIELLGEEKVVVELGADYEDAGAKATDSVDGTLTVISVSTVNTDAVGIYTVTYSVKDAAGNEAVEVTRTVEVQAKMSLDPFGKAEVKPYVPVTLYGRVRVGEVAASEGDVVAVWVVVFNKHGCRVDQGPILFKQLDFLIGLDTTEV